MVDQPLWSNAEDQTQLIQGKNLHDSEGKPSPQKLAYKLYEDTISRQHTITQCHTTLRCTKPDYISISNSNLSPQQSQRLPEQTVLQSNQPDHPKQYHIP